MMNTAAVLISLFFIMLVGFTAGKLKLFDDGARKAFSKYVFYVGTNAIVIQSIVGLTPAQLHKLPRFTLVNSVLYVGVTALTYVTLRVLRLPYDKGGTILYTGIAANAIYLGLPVIRALYGIEGVALSLVLFVIPITLADVVAFYCLSNWRNKGGSLKSVFDDFIRNPIVLSAVLGALLLLVGFHFPTSINEGLTLLGDTTTGVALFAMGLFLANITWRHFRLRTAVATSVVKLFVFPALALVVAKGFGLTGTPLGVTVLMAAMPSAVFCMVVATEYEYDERSTVDAILLSSILFLITSPIWVHLVQ